MDVVDTTILVVPVGLTVVSITPVVCAPEAVVVVVVRLAVVVVVVVGSYGSLLP